MSNTKTIVWLILMTAVLTLLGACTHPEPGASPSQTAPTATQTQTPAPTPSAEQTQTQTNKPTPTAVQTQSQNLQVYFINVGKGDASLIGFEGHWVMVDTGPVEGFPEIGRTLIRLGITKLDAVFVSHGHRDHIGGLNSVLEMTSCSQVYTIPDCLDDKEMIDAQSENGAVVNTLTAGQDVRIGDALFSCLGPVANYNEENDNSMVLMFEYEGERILFTADQLSVAESGLLKSGKDLNADVLKVAYHGGAESTSAAFVKAVIPKFAVIPTDDTRPAAQQTLSTLSQAGIQTFILGDTGTLLYDGKNISETPMPAGDVPNVTISAKDVKAESVTVQNNSAEAVDLSGWCLYSENGADAYFFPAGTKISPNESLSIFSGKAAENAQSGFVWTTKKIWSNKKTDVCLLYDGYGRLVNSR